MKLSPLAHIMIVYFGEDPGEFAGQFYKQREFSKMDGYKITV